jgi:CubicO group peptidase (beta-lactamase class C family)
MAEAEVPGLGIALIHDAQVAWTRGFGFRNRDTAEPVTPDTVFEAASLSKPLFAYAVLKACTAGMLDLDAPLSAYVPEPYIPDESRVERITARHVLSHTCGFPNWRPKGRALRMHFAAGERFAYSGEGYVYLQRVIEHLAGQTLDRWMQTQVLNPLGMVHSGYVWREAYETQASRGHDAAGKPTEPRRMLEPNATYSLYTTPRDYAAWMAPLLRPPADATRPHVATHMLTPQVPVNDAGLDAERSPAEVQTNAHVWWGLGWGLQRTPGREAFWHWGDNGVFQAFAMGLPRHRSGMVCMANSEGARSLWSKLFGLAFGTSRGGPLPAIDWLNELYSGPPTEEQDSA